MKFNDKDEAKGWVKTHPLKMQRRMSIVPVRTWNKTTEAWITMFNVVLFPPEQRKRTKKHKPNSYHL